MTASTSDYAVGRGRPPLHSRFQKGQSGNPSGKPGPAKLARQRFQRALLAALEGSPEDLDRAKPESVLAAIARKMALDACEGRVAATRLLLSLLDAESKRSEGAEEDAAEQLFTGADLVSLLQGKTQGSGKKLTEQICPALVANRPPTDSRAQLVTGTVSPPPCGEVEICEQSEANFGWGARSRGSAPPPEKRSDRLHVGNIRGNAFFDLPARGRYNEPVFPGAG